MWGFLFFLLNFYFKVGSRLFRESEALKFKKYLWCFLGTMNQGKFGAGEGEDWDWAG